MRYVELLLIFAVFAFAVGCQQQRIAEIPQPSAIKQVTPEIAKGEIDAKKAQFIDVRTPEEFGAEHAEKAVNMPLDKIETELVSLDRSKPVYIICQSGRRSQKAAETLEQNGFTDVYNIEGGTTAWKKAGLPLGAK
jgi:rhodanese-related sulfurtransferase